MWSALHADQWQETSNVSRNRHRNWATSDLVQCHCHPPWPGSYQSSCSDNQLHTSTSQRQETVQERDCLKPWIKIQIWTFLHLKKQNKKHKSLFCIKTLFSPVYLQPLNCKFLCLLICLIFLITDPKVKTDWNNLQSTNMTHPFRFSSITHNTTESRIGGILKESVWTKTKSFLRF